MEHFVDILGQHITPEILTAENQTSFFQISEFDRRQPKDLVNAILKCVVIRRTLEEYIDSPKRYFEDLSMT